MADFLVASTNTAEAESTIKAFCIPQDFACTLAPEKSAHKRLLARALTRKLLAKNTGKNDWEFLYQQNGKPYLQSFNGVETPHISWSHSKDFVAAAISLRSPLGIDIEEWCPRPFDQLAAFAFGNREQQEIKEYGEAAFYRIWTIREAKAKATGLGLWPHMDGHDQTPPISIEYSKDEIWEIHYTIVHGCSVAIAQYSG